MRKFLTPEGLKKIRKELVWRKGEKRREIAVRLAAAVEKGDLTENAEYTTAKEEQMFNEGKIQELEVLLRSVEVIESHPSDGIVAVGSKVTVLINHQKQIYQLVGSPEADPTSGKISYESPIGQILIGKRAGETIKVQAPRGKIKYKIIKVE